VAPPLKGGPPSGTAIDLSRRLIAVTRADSRGSADGPRRSGAEELDVSVIRAGAAPGMHLVGFDAPGESLEMRLTARDRSAYAAGAITAAEWLLAEPRTPGFHSFDAVVDSIIAKTSGANGTDSGSFDRAAAGVGRPAPPTHEPTFGRKGTANSNARRSPTALSHHQGATEMPPAASSGEPSRPS